jgi:hypothetical protein
MSADVGAGAEETASALDAMVAGPRAETTSVGTTAVGRDPAFDSARDDDECMPTSNSAPIPNTVPAVAPAIATVRPCDWAIVERSIAAWPSVPPVIAEWDPVAPIPAEEPCLPGYD